MQLGIWNSIVNPFVSDNNDPVPHATVKVTLLFTFVPLDVSAGCITYEYSLARIVTII